MIKSGICVKKETLTAKVISIVDEHNIECAKFFTDFMEVDDLENWNCKIEIGDYLCKSSCDNDPQKMIYSKDFVLKTVPTNFKVNTKLDSDKDGQYFVSIIKEAEQFEFQLFGKKEFEVLKSIFNNKIFETEEKLYYINKKEKGIAAMLGSIFSSRANQFFTQKQFNKQFHIIEEVTETKV